jgi:hypothetical protein
MSETRPCARSSSRLFAFCLETEDARGSEYRFEDHSSRGNGVCEGVREGAWEEVRAAIYEGRGG